MFCLLGEGLNSVTSRALVTALLVPASFPIAIKYGTLPSIMFYKLQQMTAQESSFRIAIDHVPGEENTSEGLYGINSGFSIMNQSWRNDKPVVSAVKQTIDLVGGTLKKPGYGGGYKRFLVQHNGSVKWSDYKETGDSRGYIEAVNRHKALPLPVELLLVLPFL